jgi:hypothetical protein
MLPSDRYLAELLGLTDEQYELWRDEARRRAMQGPQPAVVCGLDPVTQTILISLAISIGSSLLSLALAPSLPKRGGEIRQRSLVGQTQTSLASLAPRAGFDAVQEVAAIGEPIPVVYANRETISGVTYGGVRVNATLLWSQIWSLGGSQLLRAVFMLGEGPMASVDPLGWAIGDNSIGAYDLGSSGANESSARITIYHRPNGGRIAGADRVAGRSAANDPGSAGTSDVFMARGVGGTYQPVFSAAAKPSTSTTFGLYQLIGNNLGIKINPSIRPGVTARLKPRGSKGNSDVVCDTDQVVAVQRQKETAFFSSRSGVISGSFGLGNSFTYRLDRSSDYLTSFQSTGQDGGTWSSSFVVDERPRIFTRDTTNRITGFGFADRMTVSGVTVASGGDALEVTATFDVATVRQKLIDDNAARGQYVVKYWIQVANSLQTVQSQFDITITIQSEKKLKGKQSTTTSVSQTKDSDGKVTNVNSVTFTPELEADGFDDAITFLGEVDEDSGPVNVLTTPERLQAKIVFPIEELDAHSETAADVASTVAGRQKSWDDGLVVGELYKCGSALAVCTSRSPSDKIFISDSEDGADGTGITIDAAFEVVSAGSAATVTTGTITAAGTTTTTRQTATSGPHLLRCALGNVSTTSECRIAEIGLRSTLGQRISGLCNFRDTLTLSEVDGRACLLREGDNIKRGKKLNVDIYQSGFVSTIEERYSFFRVSYREVGSSSFTVLSPCFGVRGGTDQPTFNYLTLQMPSAKRWEYRFEPLSGWEIRSGTATGSLIILDAKLTSTVSGTSNSVTWRANGETVTRSRSNFTISTTKRANIGLPQVDDNNYLDAWGKLAEGFVYEEAQSSASNGPEHEIVYLNEIRENDTTPQYTGISLVGVNARSAFEWRQFSQLSGYVTGGVEVRRLLNSLTVGASHLLPDLALDRLTNAKYGPGRVTDDLIKLNNFQTAAQWCLDRKYFFDGGVIISDESPRQWIADTAAAMLLDFREVNGQYDLVPFLTFGVVTHKALFTAGNIDEGSFQYESIPVDDRQPVRVSVKWRQERSSANPTNPGLFPEEREVLVREAAPNGSDALPVESIDLSNFCTNENHAIDVAKFQLRIRRLRDHTIRFRTTYDGLEGISTGIGPGDYIRAALDVTVFDQFNNGVVLGNGKIVSTTALANGTYNVISWNGTDNINENATLTVSNGQGSPVGIIFTVKQVNTLVRTYQISKITPTEDGKYDVEAVHMPTGSDGKLLAAADWDLAGAWVIQR